MPACGHLLVTTPILLSLAACGGSSMSTPATLTQVQTDVFSISCSLSTSCHKGGSPFGGLNLESGSSYAQIVNKASNEVPSKMRVVAGDTMNSYLMDKVLNRNLPTGPAMGQMLPSNCLCPPTWAQMPLNNPPLDSNQMRELSSWIAAGAMNN